jgi:chorismate mutase
LYLDLLYDGLMIETHIEPDNALSDSSQQLNPAQFHGMMDRLKVKHETVDSSELQRRISELRLDIDSIDDHIIRLLAKRMEIVCKMGRIKKDNDISVLQPRRWKELIENRCSTGSDLNLSEEFVFQLFQIIHEEAIRRQESCQG